MSTAFLVAAFLASSSAVIAQPAAVPSPMPRQSKVLLDNPNVRVIEIRVMPGAKIPDGDRKGRLMYMLTDGSLVFTEDGKRPYEMIFKAGEAVWIPRQAQVTESTSEREVRAVVVEIKGAETVAKPSTRKRRGRRR